MINKNFYNIIYLQINYDIIIVGCGNMYDVFEESKNAVLNLEDNAWTNHRDEYIKTKGQVEDFKDRIKYEQIKLHEATTEEERNISQDELTKIIDEILSVNDSFNSCFGLINERSCSDREDRHTTKSYSLKMLQMYRTATDYRGIGDNNTRTRRFRYIGCRIGCRTWGYKVRYLYGCGRCLYN